MKKIITGCLLIQCLVIEPIIGYTIFRTWLKIDDMPLIFSATIFVIGAAAQMIFYIHIIYRGMVEEKIIIESR